MYYKCDLQKRKFFGRSAEKKSSSYTIPIWRDSDETFGFVFHESDLKNKHLETRLALHFALCAPNLFARCSDVVGLQQFLAPETRCTSLMVKRYRRRLAPTGFIWRSVVRYNKERDTMVATGAAHSFGPPLPSAASRAKRGRLIAAADPRLRGAERDLGSRGPTCKDETHLDLLEDYSTIFLMYRKASFQHLFLRPAVYLKSSLMIDFFSNPVPYLSTSCSQFYTFSGYNSVSIGPLNSPVGPSINIDVKGITSHQQKLIVQDALALLSRMGAQTFVANYFKKDIARYVYGIYKLMCLRLLNSQNPCRNMFKKKIESHYGVTYATWLVNAFDAFKLLVTHGKFRVGTGRPRVRPAVVDDIVASSLATRCIKSIMAFLKPKKVFRSVDNLMVIGSIYHYVYEKIAHLKRVFHTFKWRVSCSRFYDVLMNRALDWSCRFWGVCYA